MRRLPHRQTIKLDKSLGKVGISVADGMLYCLNHQGTCRCWPSRPTGSTIVSQFNVGKKPDNTYLAHPVIVGGRLYLRCEQSLLVYDVSAAEVAMRQAIVAFRSAKAASLAEAAIAAVAAILAKDAVFAERKATMAATYSHLL